MHSAKLLLVDPSPDRGARLSTALTQVGYEVALASSGSLAVSMLEQERPDVVVSQAKAGDMDGYELFTLVRKDPVTMDTPFVLLAGWDRPAALAAEEAGVEAVLTGEFGPDTVVRRIGEMLGGDQGQRSREAPATAAPKTAKKALPPLWTALEEAAARPTGQTNAALQGTLDVMDLAEVTQAVALGGKTGCLIVHLASGQADIVFESGRVVHAAFGGRTGEQAFASIISLSQRERQARFQFNRMERAEVTQGPRTISRSVEQLLLSIAVGIDEGEPGAGPLQGASPAGRADG